MRRSARPICAVEVQLVSGRALLVVGETADQRLAIVADAQMARISRPQLGTIGFTAAMIKTRLRLGQLRREHQGVYAVGHSLEVVGGIETAALLSAGPPAALAVLSAAAWWRFTANRPDGVELIVPARRPRPSPRGIRVYRSRSLTADDVVIRHQLPVTSAARTLLDMAARREAHEVERALDEGLHQRHVSPTKIREIVARHPNHRGGALLLELLEPGRGAGVTRSKAERRLLQILREAGIGDAERNAPIGPYTVDFLWREAGVVVEVDSYRWHSGPAAFKRDRRKDAYLRDDGLDVIRVTWEMMDSPLPLVARIVRAIERGSQKMLKQP
jgi:very-short-patch-repair endonuclease